MASTRNINTPGDYCHQQKEIDRSRDYTMYVNSQVGQAYHTAVPCVGITPSHMPRDAFSYNPVEIETTLFGINSTNLVHPTTPATPELKQLQFVPFFDRQQVILPEPLVIEAHQRPFVVPGQK